jgi:hypothetical protein
VDRPEGGGGGTFEGDGASARRFEANPSATYSY